jgi:hypothetical protein
VERERVDRVCAPTFSAERAPTFSAERESKVCAPTFSVTTQSVSAPQADQFSP